jgi:hypothetical protein
MEHFPTLRMENVPNAKTFSFFSKNSAPALKIFGYEATIKSFSIPFYVDVETSGRISEGDDICDTDPRNEFRYVQLLDYHKLCLPTGKSAVVSDHVRRITSLFESIVSRFSD